MMMEIENRENADPNAMQKRKYMCEVFFSKFCIFNRNFQFQTNVAELIIRQLLEVKNDKKKLTTKNFYKFVKINRENVDNF